MGIFLEAYIKQGKQNNFYGVLCSSFEVSNIYYINSHLLIIYIFS